MEFYQRICFALLWMLPWLACASDPLDDLNLLVYQYPAEANKKLIKLEEEFRNNKIKPFNELRLKMLRCEALLQLGEYEAAINLAQTGDAMAKQQDSEHLRPYFMSCLASAYNSYNNIHIALPQLDAAITLSKRYQDPQALLTTLRLRGQIEIENNNFTAAIEDLRLAIDVYDNISMQKNNWTWPPKAYVLATMANLLYATGDFQQAMSYIEQGLQRPEAIGKIRHVILRDAAKIAFAMGDIDASDKYLKEARILLPELSTPIELAKGYVAIAAIEIDRGRYDKTQDLLDVALNTFEQQSKQLDAMHTHKLLADVAFAKGENKTGLALLNKAINTAKQLEAYSDLAKYQLAVAHYYADQSKYQNAYQYLEQSYQASNKANSAANHTRILQFKARLSQRVSDATLAKVFTDTLDERRQINWMYLFLFAVIILLLAMVIWQLMRHIALRRALQAESSPRTPMQHLENAIQHAKRGEHSLSLLVISCKDVPPACLSSLNEVLANRLRKTDMIFPRPNEEKLILLPYTNSAGVEFVKELLIDDFSKHSCGAIQMGYASMQQFDTCDTLIKRATIRGISRA